jgi:flagellar hook-associated protein 3 FlgL
MRIATSQFQATMNRGLQENQSQVAAITAAIASGNRIQVPSDDPVGNVRLSRLTREQAIVTQYSANIGAIKIRMSSNEAYLTSMVNDITQVHDQLVWASDGSNTIDDLKSMVTTMTSLRDSILYSANEKDQEGRYIFSGTLTNTPAIGFDASAQIGSRYTFTGNNGQQKSVVGNGITQVVNVDVDGLQGLLNKLDATIAALSAPDAASGSPELAAALKDNMDSASSTLEFVAGKIATLGGAQNVMETLANNHDNVSLSNRSAIKSIGELDIGEATIEMNGYTLALQASYKAYSKIANLSLFNIL